MTAAAYVWSWYAKWLRRCHVVGACRSRVSRGRFKRSPETTRGTCHWGVFLVTSEALAKDYGCNRRCNCEPFVPRGGVLLVRFGPACFVVPMPPLFLAPS